jgi:hypothetical protein
MQCRATIASAYTGYAAVFEIAYTVLQCSYARPVANRRAAPDNNGTGVCGGIHAQGCSVSVCYRIRNLSHCLPPQRPNDSGGGDDEESDKAPQPVTGLEAQTDWNAVERA